MSSIKVETTELEEEPLELPPGFKFHPTDEEIITHYLTAKVADDDFQARAIGEADLNRCEPWDLPSKAKMGEKEWYFFCQRERRYPTGTRTNRATEAGYWKATGKDKEIYKGKNCLVGMKKTLVFYRGRAPKGDKTNWVMHEYRLEGSSPRYNSHGILKDSWVVCRIFDKGGGLKNASTEEARADSVGMELQSEDYLASPSMASLLYSPREKAPRDGTSYILDDGDYKSIPSSSSFPSYLSSSMALGNFEGYQNITTHHGLQADSFNPEKSPLYDYPQTSFLQSYDYFQALPDAGVHNHDKNHYFPFKDNILRGAAAVKNSSGQSDSAAPPENGLLRE